MSGPESAGPEPTPLAPDAPIPEALHHEVRAERDRIFKLIEARVRRLLRALWPWTSATEPIAVLERIGEEIEPGWHDRIAAIAREEVQAIEKGNTLG